MRQVELFGTASEPDHPYAELAERLWALARKNIYFGSSSWKYESWQGTVYARHYKSKKAFDQECLEEYAKTFPAVGGDFSFYNWPSQDMIARIDAQTPNGFKIGLKATEYVTLKRFPNLGRWGENAGKDNPDFLNAKLFSKEFLEKVAPIELKLAPIILEFTAFPRGAFADWTEFAHALESFLIELRKVHSERFAYGIEVRNREYLHAEFWSALSSMNVSPILNSWTRMPPLDEQFKLFGHFDFPFIECRPIMRPGRTRDEAVMLFEPYAKIRERVEPARRAMKGMVQWALKHQRPCYIFINNHLEGCAHQTIEELTKELA